MFKLRQGEISPTLRKMKTGVSHGVILSPTLLNKYTSNVPVNKNTLLAAYANSATILSQSGMIEEAADLDGAQLDRLEGWFTNW